MNNDLISHALKKTVFSESNLDKLLEGTKKTFHQGQKIGYEEGYHDGYEVGHEAVYSKGHRCRHREGSDKGHKKGALNARQEVVVKAKSIIDHLKNTISQLQSDMKLQDEIMAEQKIMILKLIQRNREMEQDARLYSSAINPSRHSETPIRQ